MKHSTSSSGIESFARCVWMRQHRKLKSMESISTVNDPVGNTLHCSTFDVDKTISRTANTRNKKIGGRRGKLSMQCKRKVKSKLSTRLNNKINFRNGLSQFFDSIEQYPWFYNGFQPNGIEHCMYECKKAMFLSEWTHQQKLQKNFNVKILSKIRNKLKWSFWFNNTIIKYECVGVCTTERIPRMDLKSWHFQTNFVALKLLFGRLSNIYILNFCSFWLSSALAVCVCCVLCIRKTKLFIRKLFVVLPPQSPTLSLSSSSS